MSLTPEQAGDLLCNATLLENYFTFPDDFNVTALLHATCGVSAEQLTAEFEEIFQQSELMRQVG